jgi:hypothetical protein
MSLTFGMCVNAGAHRQPAMGNRAVAARLRDGGVGISGGLADRTLRPFPPDAGIYQSWVSHCGTGNRWAREPPMLPVAHVHVYM